MRIGEMARQLGLAPETLRYYERLGLLPSPARNRGHDRQYAEKSVGFVLVASEESRKSVTSL